MAKSVPGIPRPEQIGLNVKFQMLTPARLGTVAKQLEALPGWQSGLLGLNGGTIRYGYTERRARLLWGRAMKKLQQLVAEPACETFVIWRVDWPFRREMEPKIFGPIATTIGQYQGVISAHSMGTYANGSHWGMYIEFKGEPWRELVRQTGEYLRTYTRM